MPEITVEGLSKAFGQERALTDISFSVRDKEFLTLLGPSGCGKTTTLMSIAGFQRPDGGAISCGDRIFFDKARKVSAEDQQTATAISKLANPLLLHLPLPTMNYLPSFAFATSPAHIDRGAAYEFVLNHVLDVDSPADMFRLEMGPSHAC